MNRWHGYFAIERLPLLSSDENWYTILASTYALEGVDRAVHQRNHWRGCVDTVVYGEHILPRIVIFEADFPADSVSFAAYRTRLANAVGVDPATVTLDESNVTFGVRPSALCVFARSGNRMRVGLFGCQSDEILCTREESRIEAVAYINNNIAIFEEDVP